MKETIDIWIGSKLKKYPKYFIMRKVQEYSGCRGMLKTLTKDKHVWPQDLGGFEQGLQ